WRQPGLLDVDDPSAIGQQDLYARRIKKCASAFLEIGERLVVAPGVLVRPFGGQGVEHIGNRHDARVEGNLLATQPVRIATAVPALVVPQGNLCAGLDETALA